MVTEDLILTENTLFQLRHVIDEKGYLLLSEMLANQHHNNAVAYHFVDVTKIPGTNVRGYHKEQYTHRG